jgi:hypothetical protein
MPDSYLAIAVSSASTSYFIMLWIVLGTVGHLLVAPFKRRVGGVDPNTGQPGGSEKEIVGAIWFLAAIITGVLMTR